VSSFSFNGGILHRHENGGDKHGPLDDSRATTTFFNWGKDRGFWGDEGVDVRFTIFCFPLDLRSECFLILLSGSGFHPIAGLISPVASARRGNHNHRHRYPRTIKFCNKGEGITV